MSCFNRLSVSLLADRHTTWTFFFLIKSVEKVEHGSRKKLLISGSDRSRVDTGNYFHNSVAPAAYELAGLATPWASRPLWRNFAFPFNQPVDNLQFNFQ